MPRTAKPYLHRGWYVTNSGGPRTKLCPEQDGPDAADDAFRRLLDERRGNGGRPYPNLRVEELFALFLDTVKVEKSQATYDDYRRWLTVFADKYGRRPAKDITRPEALAFRNALAVSTYPVSRVTRGKDRGKAAPVERRTYKPKSVNHAVIALKRCWNWAADIGHLPPGRNPFAKLPLLHAEGRQRIVTDDEFRALLRHCTDINFRHVLLMLRHTCARPGEVRTMTWGTVDWDNERVVLTRHKTSRTQKTPRPRIIPLLPSLVSLLRWLQKRHGHQPYCFLNRDGRPWSKDALVERMDGLRTRAGIGPDENGEELVLYSNRHTFITEAAGTEGLSGPLLQQLAGHTDPRTTERYAHLANREIQRAGRRVAESLRTRKPGK